MNFIILFISGPEIIVILLVVLLLFGSKKIPEFARGIGKGMREFRKATEDIKRELNEETNEIRDGIKDIKDNLTGD
jgi:sec-independent protein translocase protein TatA